MARRVGQRRRRRMAAEGVVHERRDAWRKAYRKDNPFDLPDDVLRNICLQAQKALPYKASWGLGTEGTGYAQDTLARLMRVSKRLYLLAAPILYIEIVSTDLAAVIYGADVVQVDTSVPTKSTLLAKCRHLHLEFLSWRSLRGVRDLCLATLQIPNGVTPLAIEEDLAAAERAIRLGGLAQIFPTLETFALSSRTSDCVGSLARHRDTVALWHDRLQELYVTSQSVLRCGSKSTMRGHFVDYTNFDLLQKNHTFRQGRPLRVSPAQYLHLGPHSEWDILFRQPIVLLYCRLYEKAPPPGVVFFENLFHSLRNVVYDVVAMRYHGPDQFWRADIELRIPRSCMSHDPFHELLDRYDEDTEIALLIGRLLNEYEDLGEDSERAHGDTWRIVFTDGPQYCPCCMVAVSPEAMAECRGETGFDKADEADWSLAFLWPDVE